MDNETERPFDPSKESVFCARCGTKYEELGHMTGKFMMCPKHGEFTIGPLVVKRRDWYVNRAMKVVHEVPREEQDKPEWTITFHDKTEESMWDNCQAIDGMIK